MYYNVFDEYLKLGEDYVDLKLSKACKNMFNLVEENRVRGVGLKHLKIFDNKIVADVNYLLKDIAVKDEEDNIIINPKLSFDNKIFFVELYDKDFMYDEILNRINKIKSVYFGPLLRDLDDYQEFIDNRAKYERFILNDKEKEDIDLVFYDTCNKMFELKDSGVDTYNISDDIWIYDNKIFLNKSYLYKEYYYLDEYDKDFYDLNREYYNLNREYYNVEIARRKRNGNIKIKNGHYESKMEFLRYFHNLELYKKDNKKGRSR